MNEADMVALWDQHTYYEFALKNAGLAVSTMVDDARVMHLPTMSGASGKEQLRRYYADVFIPAIPDGTVQELICRSLGTASIVDEAILVFPHDREIPFLAPGVKPTGRTLEVPFVVVVRFRDQLMESERLYWDQAAVLAQLGLVTAGELPLASASDVVAYLRKQAVPA
jgi:carboxymethylenebutenolidase